MPLPDLDSLAVEVVLSLRVNQRSIVIEFLLRSAFVKKLERRDRDLLLLRPDVAVQVLRMQAPQTLP